LAGAFLSPALTHMAFNADIRQFRTPADLSAYLSTLPSPDWPGANPIGSTYHNTYVPTEAQWHGQASMESMRAHYISLGWTSAPHFFLALHSPESANNGIWMMTPPTAPGTHAGACNSTRFGIEVVGDFGTKAPSAAQQQLLVDTVAALHIWAKLGAVLNAHRDCMAGRTCPGDAFYSLKAELIARLAVQLADPLATHLLPGTPGPKKCSQAVYDFYYAAGRSFPLFGYATANEERSVSSNGIACTITTCERAIIKRSETYGVELALLSEARAQGWLP